MLKILKVLYNKSQNHPPPYITQYNKTQTHLPPHQRYIICARSLKCSAGFQWKFGKIEGVEKTVLGISRLYIIMSMVTYQDSDIALTAKPLITVFIKSFNKYFISEVDE